MENKTQNVHKNALSQDFFKTFCLLCPFIQMKTNAEH